MRCATCGVFMCPRRGSDKEVPPPGARDLRVVDLSGSCRVIPGRCRARWVSGVTHCVSGTADRGESRDECRASHRSRRRTPPALRAAGGDLCVHLTGHHRSSGALHRHGRRTTRRTQHRFHEHVSAVRSASARRRVPATAADLDTGPCPGWGIGHRVRPRGDPGFPRIPRGLPRGDHRTRLLLTEQRTSWTAGLAAPPWAT